MDRTTYHGATTDHSLLARDWSGQYLAGYLVRARCRLGLAVVMGTRIIVTTTVVAIFLLDERSIGSVDV